MAMALMAAVPRHEAVAQRAIDVAAGYRVVASVLSPATDGSTSLLLLSETGSPDLMRPPDRPPVLELLSIDASGSAVRRQRLDQTLADAVGDARPAACSHLAAAATGRGFILAASRPYEDGPLTILATVFEVAPDGRVLRKIDIGHPGFADAVLRKKTDIGLCVTMVVPGPDGSLLVAGDSVETRGAGARHPWWAAFDANGRQIAQAGREDQLGEILAARLGENGSLLTVRSLWRAGVGRLAAQVSLHTQSLGGASSTSVVLEKNEFGSSVVFTDNEFAVVSISNRWTTEQDCSFGISFFSLDGRPLRSNRYSFAGKCESPPGEGMPENLTSDRDGLLALVEPDDYRRSRIARFDREGRIVWRSPLAEYLALASRRNGGLVALERAKTALVLRKYP